MNACFSKEEMDSVILDIPVGRLGKPQELADLVCFIASEKAGYLTGAVISLDGGFTL
jgi:NAD(P)-dependent dehydrogenase (short-subunit alcohol dehydrogenase family)